MAARCGGVESIAAVATVATARASWKGVDRQRYGAPRARRTVDKALTGCARCSGRSATPGRAAVASPAAIGIRHVAVGTVASIAARSATATCSTVTTMASVAGWGVATIAAGAAPAPRSAVGAVPTIGAGCRTVRAIRTRTARDTRTTRAAIAAVARQSTTIPAVPSGAPECTTDATIASVAERPAVTPAATAPPGSHVRRPAVSSVTALRDGATAGAIGSGLAACARAAWPAAQTTRSW